MEEDEKAIREMLPLLTPEDRAWIAALVKILVGGSSTDPDSECYQSLNGLTSDPDLSTSGHSE